MAIRLRNMYLQVQRIFFQVWYMKVLTELRFQPFQRLILWPITDLCSPFKCSLKSLSYLRPFSGLSALIITFTWLRDTYIFLTLNTHLTSSYTGAINGRNEAKVPIKYSNNFQQSSYLDFFIKQIEYGIGDSEYF